MLNILKSTELYSKMNELCTVWITGIKLKEKDKQENVSRTEEENVPFLF